MRHWETVCCCWVHPECQVLPYQLCMLAIATGDDDAVTQTCPYMPILHNLWLFLFLFLCVKPAHLTTVHSNCAFMWCRNNREKLFLPNASSGRNNNFFGTWVAEVLISMNRFYMWICKSVGGRQGQEPDVWFPFLEWPITFEQSLVVRR